MAKILLEADCSHCVALCCVGLAFDRGTLFGLDKPAGTPCPYLSTHTRCSIHAQRSAYGFAGCARYDCYGAGQRVTEQLFDGRSWQDDPALLPGMLDAFRAMRQVHELLVLLEAAKKLPLSASARHRLEELQAALEPDGGWSSAGLAELERGPLCDDVTSFLRSLAGYASGECFASSRPSSSR